MGGHDSIFFRDNKSRNSPTASIIYLKRNKAGELMEQLEWTRQALSKARKAQHVFSVEIKGEA
jgi:hypothetical protein